MEIFRSDTDQSGTLGMYVRYCAGALFVPLIVGITINAYY